jgi:outer membrane autotransporter protein
MKQRKTYALKGTKAAAAVAAALFTLGSAAHAATYTQIGTTLDAAGTDAVVSYTDQTDPASVGSLAPVEAGSDTDAATGITLTLNSLTVTNTVSAASTGISPYGISSANDLTGTATGTATGGVHLAVTGDVSVTTVGNSLVTGSNNNIDGTIGGNLTVRSTEGGAAILGSAGTTDRYVYRGVDLTLSGGTASITADKGYGIETNAASAIVQIAGAGSTTVTSNSTFAILADSGSVNLYGTGEDHDGGTVAVESLQSAAAAIMSDSDGTVTIDAGSVTVKDTAASSAAIEVTGHGLVSLKANDTSGTGVQVLNNSDSPTIYAASEGSVVIRADSAPIQVINQSGGQVILSDNADPSTGVTINGDLTASSVQVVGNVTATNDSRVAIHESGTGSYLKANKITASDSWVYLVLTGDVAYTSQTGGTSEVSVDGTGGRFLLQEQDSASSLADISQTSGAGAIVMLSDTSTLTGNVTESGSGTQLQADFGTGTAWTGDLSASDGALATVTLAGTWTGSSTLSGGTTDVTFMDANAVWNVTRDSELTNFTQGAGTVNYPTADAKSFTGTTITVDGNYSADGGSLNMSTVLTGDTSPHDKLVVKGDTSGTASITFTRVTGWGAQTIEGIKVVEVDGTSDAVFTKPDSNRLTAGAYVYDLKKVGNDWYLTSQRDPNAPTIILPKTNDDPAPTPDPDNGDDLPDVLPSVDPGDITAHNVKPELGSYAANMLASNTLFTMSLNDRLGETRYSDALKSQKHSGNVWIRMAGGKSHTEMADDQLTNRGDWGLVQVGGDVVSWAGSGDHRFHVGLMMGYAHQNEKTRSSAIGSTSKGKVSGYSAGLYATYMNAAPAATGPYVDTWLLWQKFKNKVDPSNSVEESYDSKGFTGSIEAGYTFGLKDWVSADGTKNAARLQLQAQVIRMGVRADQHIDAENFTVAGTGAGNIRTRVGATVYHLFTNEKTGRAVKPFIGLNWYHDTKTFGVTYDGIHDRIQGNRNFGELKLGVEGKLSKHVNLWGAAAYQQGSHSFRNLGAFIGAKVLF